MQELQFHQASIQRDILMQHIVADRVVFVHNSNDTSQSLQSMENGETKWMLRCFRPSENMVTYHSYPRNIIKNVSVDVNSNYVAFHHSVNELCKDNQNNQETSFL